MAKIIQFPTGEEIKQRSETKQMKDEYTLVREASDEAVTSAQYLLEIMEEFITTGDVSHNFMDMQFRDETFQESRDMFVIVNMINAMFHRYYGIPHSLHREFDRLYGMIKVMDKTNSRAEFSLDDGDDDDTT